MHNHKFYALLYSRGSFVFCFVCVCVCVCVVFNCVCAGQGWDLNLSVTAVDGTLLQQRPAVMGNLPEATGNGNEANSDDEFDDEEDDRKSIKSGKTSKTKASKAASSKTGKSVISSPSGKSTTAPKSSPVRFQEPEMQPPETATDGTPDISAILKLAQAATHPSIREMHIQAMYADPAICPRANLRLEPNPDLLCFTSTNIGGRSRRTLQLSNASPVPVPFHWAVWHRTQAPSDSSNNSAGGKMDQLRAAMEQFQAQEERANGARPATPQDLGSGSSALILPHHLPSSPADAAAESGHAATASKSLTSEEDSEGGEDSPWFSVEPARGVIGPFETLEFSFGFSPDELNDGCYADAHFVVEQV